MDRLIANRVLNLCFASQEYLQGPYFSESERAWQANTLL